MWWLRRISPKKQLIISLSVGLIVGIGVWQYLENVQRNIQSQYNMKQVWVARKHVKKGTLVSKDLFEIRKIPEAFLQPTALTVQDDILNDLGQEALKTRIEILKGEQLTRSKLYDEASNLGLAYQVPIGKTALTLLLPVEEAVARLIQPGDWVHINWANENISISALLSRIRVLAVDRNIWDPTSDLESKNIQKELQINSVLVTLSVSLEEAAWLRLARQRGRMGLSLVSPLDTNPVSSMRKSKADFMRFLK